MHERACLPLPAGADATHGKRVVARTRYQRLFDAMPVGMFRSSVDGRLLDANPALVRMLGLSSREALMAMNVAQLLAAGHGGSFWRERLDRAGLLSGAELELRRADGARIWVRVNARADWDGDGEPSYEGVVEDVTLRKRTEERLSQSQQRLELVNRFAAEMIRATSAAEMVETALRELAEHFPGLRAVYSTIDARGRLWVWRSRGPDGMPSIAGWACDLTAAPLCLEALRAGERVAVADVSRDARLGGLREALAQRGTQAMLGVPVRHSEQLVGLACLDSPLPRTWSEHELLTLAALGEYLSLALREAYAEEERKRADEARARLQTDLERAAQEWTMTFDALAIAIVVLDGAGRVMRLNRAALELACGAEYDEVVGRLPAQISGREPWRSFAELVRRVRDGGRAAAKLHDAASGKTWLVTLGPMRRAADAEERFLLTARDLTEIVSLQQALGLSQTMAAMGSLVAGVAHEVRNPLFSISASLDALERRFGSDAETRPHAAVLRRSVQRLSDLMAELLEYGRPQNNQLLPGSLHDVLEEAIESCQAQARTSRVTISDRTAPGLPLVPMDRGRLALVFRNLVENALHHSPAGGTVTVEAAQSCDACGPALDCRVRDCGPGFREEDLPRIFEPFFTRRRGGTGLGLSIAQRIVHGHGGSISAFNHPEGGAVVGVRLPCAGTAG